MKTQLVLITGYSARYLHYYNLLGMGVFFSRCEQYIIFLNTRGDSIMTEIIAQVSF